MTDFSQDALAVFVEHRSVKLPKGGVLEVDLTADALGKIAAHFGLSSSDRVTDDHVRMFFFGACKTALDRAEQESAAAQ